VISSIDKRVNLSVENHTGLLNWSEPFVAAAPSPSSRLLVVIAIIGTLAGLILPAVQSAREAGRLNACRNNLVQLTKGLIHHETSKGYFPSGGWGPAWLGVAARHSDSSQPGSWIFSLMPYIEEGNTRKIVADLTPAKLRKTLPRASPRPACPRSPAPRADRCGPSIQKHASYYADPPPAPPP
jgi:type II secretory pathway pseudopilin PulG